MNAPFQPEVYKQQLLASGDIRTCPKVPVPEFDENQSYIFISYAHRDYRQVYADLADMYSAGVRFWYDRGLSAGKKWEEEVCERLTDRHCVGVIFYMSENLFLSSSANREIEITLGLMANKSDTFSGFINYFCVNLTDRSPVSILSAAMALSRERPLDMRQISILCQAFPDNSTYICYHAPDHRTELLSQIDAQFGVVDQQGQRVTLYQDAQPCTVFIGSLLERLDSPERVRIIRELQQLLEEAGLSSCVMHAEQPTDALEPSHAALNDFFRRQDEVRLASARALLIITTALGWLLCAQAMGEFSPDAAPAQRVLYLIDGASQEAFLARQILSDALRARIFCWPADKQKLLSALQAPDVPT